MTIQRPVKAKRVVGPDVSGIEVQAYRVGFVADGPEPCWVKTLTTSSRAISGDSIEIVVIPQDGVAYRTEAIKDSDDVAWVEGD